MKRLLTVLLLVGVAAGMALIAGRSTYAGTPPGISVTPVNGKSVGHGLRLWVHVYYAKGGNHGPPPGHGGGGGGGGGGSVDCTDDNSQTGFAAPFAQAEAISFHANTATFPSNLSSSSILGALSSSAGTWNQAAKGGSLLAVSAGGTATGPAQNGISELGWAHLSPKNVLAATWTWTNTSNQIVEADLFYNNGWTWDIFGSCPSAPTGHFDVADIGTHEMGHALGLNHFSDSGAQATMYPSAPADETRKTTLTKGDEQALQAAIAGAS
jgi:hypothetical protein